RQSSDSPRTAPRLQGTGRAARGRTAERAAGRARNGLMRPAMRRLNHCYNVADLRSAARRRLPRGVFDYLDKGTEDQLSLQNNRHALESLKLLQRVLADVSDVQPACELLGGAAS